MQRAVNLFVLIFAIGVLLFRLIGQFRHLGERGQRRHAPCYSAWLLLTHSKGRTLVDPYSLAQVDRRVQRIRQECIVAFALDGLSRLVDGFIAVRNRVEVFVGCFIELQVVCVVVLV